MTRKSGFSLIELLVVIAIIAILAGIILPVFTRAKENAYRSSDMTNMNSIRTALQLYRADQGAYPPQLLGYVSVYQTGPNAGQLIPADQYKGALVTRRIDSVNTLKPSYNRAKMTDTTTAVWPNGDARGVGSAPILDLDGDGDIDSSDDFQNARQLFGRSSYYMSTSPYGTSSQANAAVFYKVSGFEVAELNIPNTAPITELRYTLFWTGWGTTTGSINDDPRQLGYTDPPDTTVVTWDSYFRDYNSAGALEHAKKDIVLFLGGAARPFDSVLVDERAYRLMP